MSTINISHFPPLPFPYRHTAPVLIAIIIGCSSIINPTGEYPATYLKGMNVFFTSSRNSFHPEEFGRALDEMSAIGINTLFIVDFHFSSDENSDSIFSNNETIPESTLCAIVELTRSKGMEPVFKPHIDLLNGKPRYCINPAHMDRWIAAYREIMMEYVAISNRYGLKRIVVGTELDGVAGSPYFSAFISDDIRATFTGEVIYASSFDNFLACGIWDCVDIIGVNTYFNLCRNDHCPEAELTESWSYWLNLLDRFSIAKGKPICITEVGFYSRLGCAINPGDWSRGGEISFDEQAKAYESLLCQSTNFRNIHGIFWWQWELNNQWNSDSADYTPHGKPAELIIKKYWSDDE